MARTKFDNKIVACNSLTRKLSKIRKNGLTFRIFGFNI